MRGDDGQLAGSRPRDGRGGPFRRRAFLWLWLGTVGLSVGSWAQLVGTQWVFVHDANAATIVALVQTVSTLPVMLLVLPAGVIADAFDRRYLLLGVHGYLVLTSATLAALLVMGLLPPIVLLGFVFVVNAGTALHAAVWQPLVAELVPRKDLATATRMDMVSGNLGRMAGPVLAGALIAQLGVEFVFMLNALCSAAFFAVLLMWGRPRVRMRRRERFLPALRAGGRYVRHEPGVRILLGRLAMYLLAASAMWVALPLIVDRQLGLGAPGYGVLMSLAGLGAVAGALASEGLRRRISANRLVAISGAVFVVAFASTQIAAMTGLVAVAYLLCGATWTATVSTVNAELQLLLPGWVRARALAMMMVVFAGTQALASPLWGIVIQVSGLSLAVWIAALVGAVAVAVGRFWRLPEGIGVDHSPVAEWRDTHVVILPPPETGPVVLSVEYRVPTDRQAGFLDAMASQRRARLRSGAYRWELHQVGEEPEHFVELVTADTWDGLRRQRERSLTVADRAIEAAVMQYVVGPPRTRHLLPPEGHD